MLSVFVIAYLIVNIGIGLWAYKRVKHKGDFLLAGRKLSLGFSTMVIFATWFGSETLMGATSQFAKEGVLGIIEDPFGAALCLILAGLFFAKKLYRLNLLTFGDFYGLKYGKSTEFIASILLVISYFGWIAAQMIALGTIISSILPLTYTLSLLIGSSVVIIYTLTGGMVSVSITDFIQSILIIVGIIIALFYLVDIGEIPTMISKMEETKKTILPLSTTPVSLLNYIAAWITIGLGSIPQQDVYQRIMSSKDEKTAVYSSILAGFLYLTIALIPMLLVLYAQNHYPLLIAKNPQSIVSTLILEVCPYWLKVLFTGALLSAIMSTASGAILAPAAVLSENLFSKISYLSNIKGELTLLRWSVFIVSIFSMFMAFSSKSIFELSSEASAFSLVSLFVPLVVGIYGKNHNSWSAISSMLLGLVTWIGCLVYQTKISPLMYGLLASVLAYLLMIPFYKRFYSINL